MVEGTRGRGQGRTERKDSGQGVVGVQGQDADDDMLGVQGPCSNF